MDAGRRVGAGPRRFHDAHLRRVELLHDFFDGHVGEMLRVEHEAVVLIQLREAETRLVVRVELLRFNARPWEAVAGGKQRTRRIQNEKDTER